MTNMTNASSLSVTQRIATPSANLVDHAARERFIHETHRNFSIIAPAGVGKTTAIVRRIVQIARGIDNTANDTKESNSRGERLKKLVVVTYTNKAAQEMFERVYHALHEEPNGRELIYNLQDAFFGTLHSFCLSLLQRHGHHLGLPSNIQLLTNPELEWTSFLSRLNDVPWRDEHKSIHEHPLFRYVEIDQLLKLGSSLKPIAEKNLPSSTPAPQLDLQELLNFQPKRKTSAQAAIDEGKEIVRRWLENEQITSTFNPVPMWERGGKEFIELWVNSFKPLAEWIEKESILLASILSKAYRSHRISKGLLTYDDQVELCRELLRVPEAARAIAAAEYEIILDEAQDTDPDQFRVLFTIAQTLAQNLDPNRVSQENGNDHQPTLRPGAFCMVGDPQQLIYRSRADLAFYQKVRSTLLAKGGEELVFEVTFRCAESIISQVNQLGTRLLDGTNGQTDYVKLESRPNVNRGQTLRWHLPEFMVPANIKGKTEFLSQMEARLLGEWLVASGCQKLQARAWHEIAILAPRKQWLEPIADALIRQGLQVQLHSTGRTLGDDSFYKWIAACVTVLVHPYKSYEIVGILRDIFGYSDEALYHFVEEKKGSFQIAEPIHISSTHASGEIASTLNQLAELRKKLIRLNLREGTERLIYEMRMIERLQKIGELDKNDKHESTRKMESILTLASLNESHGMHWNEWQLELIESLKTTVTEESILEDHIQLLTCHKAKGLEWDCVLLPFFYKPQYEKSPNYPYIVRQISGEMPHLIMEAGTRLLHKADLDLKALQERQRLLYVSLTRPRNTLIIVDDFDLFHTTQGKPYEKSFGYLTEHHLLPELAELTADLNLTSIDSSKKIDSRSETSSFDLSKPFDLPEISISKMNALDIANKSRGAYRRILPHLMQHPIHQTIADLEISEVVIETIEMDDVESLASSESLTPSAQAHTRKSDLDYGIWWHQMCQAIDWSKHASWQKTFETKLDLSPNPTRAQTEWNLFLKSPLAQALQQTDWIIHTELNIFHRSSPDIYADGMMDLLLLNVNESKAWVIDWKTDRMPHPEELKQIYREQILLYRTAVEKITKFPTHASIYSTPYGQMIECL